MPVHIIFYLPTWMSYLSNFFDHKGCNPEAQKYFNRIPFSIEIYKMNNRYENKEDGIEYNIIAVNHDWWIEKVTKLVEVAISFILDKNSLVASTRRKCYIFFIRLNSRILHFRFFLWNFLSILYENDKLEKFIIVLKSFWNNEKEATWPVACLWSSTFVRDIAHK